MKIARERIFKIKNELYDICNRLKRMNLVCKQVNIMLIKSILKNEQIEKTKIEKEKD